MLTSFDTRLSVALREQIEEQRADYINELSNIDLTKPSAIILVAKAQERYETWGDLLFILEDLLKKLAE